MQFVRREVGDYRIQAGATVVPNGGFLASAKVDQVRNGEDLPLTVFSEDRLAGGYLFGSAEEAINFAMDAGHRALRVVLANRR